MKKPKIKTRRWRVKFKLYDDPKEYESIVYGLTKEEAVDRIRDAYPKIVVYLGFQLSGYVTEDGDLVRPSDEPIEVIDNQYGGNTK